MNKPVSLELSILKLSEILMYENQNLMKKQNCFIWIQAVSLYT